MKKPSTFQRGKRLHHLSTIVDTGNPHYRGRTIQQIIDTDSNGDNIVFLLRYRSSGGDDKLTADGYPFGYHDFSDEVNASLDVYLYANPPLLEKFKPRFSKGQLTLKLKEIDTKYKIQKEREAKAFQEKERKRMEELLHAARVEEERRTKYSGEWGAW